MVRPKVAILGVTGMIGSGIYSALKDDCSLLITYRDPVKLDLLYGRYGRSADCVALSVDFNSWYPDYLAGFAGESLSPTISQFQQSLSECDWVINAMGVTKAIADVDPARTLFINGAVPHILAAMFGDKLIHITTDCVFDGAEGAPYNESSPKRPVDLYGLSKLIGEPSNALVLRTSTIGPELGTKYGLLEWFMSRTEAVPGFTNHLWNGITAHELGKICSKLVTEVVAHPGAGTYHIFAEDIAKNDLLKKIKDRYGLTTNIEPSPARVSIDRRLSSRHSFYRQLGLPSLDRMITELPELVTTSLSLE